MIPDSVVVFALVLLALGLFVWERFSFDLTALIVLGLLLVTGMVTPEEGLSGFANRATVTIAAMFVLSEGLRRTGFLDVVGEALLEAGRRRFRRTLAVLLVTVGVVSAFINNTAAVAIFIPVVIRISGRLQVSPSKLLIPMSFAAMVGGVSTLVGTSTNLLVSSIAEDAGVGGFGMFDFTPVGAAFFAVGLVYLLATAARLPPRRSPDDLTGTYGVGEYLSEVAVAGDSPLAGRTLSEVGLTRGLDLDVLEVLRPHGREGGAGSSTGPLPAGGDGEAGLLDEGGPAGGTTEGSRPRGRDIVLEAGDILLVRGRADHIERLLDQEGLSVRPPREWADADLETDRGSLVEAVVAPDSPMVQRPVGEVDFPTRFGAIVLALRHRGRIEKEKMADRVLSGGDSLLLVMDPERIDELRSDESFVVVSGVGTRTRRDRMPVAVAILAAVVATAAMGVAPIVVTSLVGVVAMLLTGCLDLDHAYEAVNWKIIVLLAGILPLGVAMEKSGAAGLIAEQIVTVLGGLGPHAVLAGFLGATMLLTAMVTNNATAVLLAPVALSAADALSVDPWPLLMGVAYAASLSFITPIGYQTNTLVYGPGAYRFTDYTRVGAPLNLAFLILGTLLIPMAFPFEGGG